MKRILQVIILLISVFTFSQENLIGKYCWTFGEGDAICVDFKDNNRFEYENSSCLGIISFGSGVFSLENNRLKLIFDKKKQELNSQIVITESTTLSDNETEFKFEIKDQYGFMLPLKIMRLSDSINFRIDEITQNIKVSGNSPKETYRVSSIGYEIIYLELDSKTDKKIQITLFEEQPVLISDKEINWKLTDINKNGFSVEHSALGSRYIKVEK